MECCVHKSLLPPLLLSRLRDLVISCASSFFFFASSSSILFFIIALGPSYLPFTTPARPPSPLKLPTTTPCLQLTSYSTPSTSISRHNLTGVLEGALRSSNAQYEPSFVLDRIGVRLLEVRTYISADAVRQDEIWRRSSPLNLSPYSLRSEIRCILNRLFSLLFPLFSPLVSTLFVLF
jgi:hypothetical protein